MRSLGFSALLLPIAAVLIVGCAQRPSDEDYDDIAVSVGALVADDGEVGSMGAGLEAAAGEVPAGMSRDGEGSFSGARGALNYSFAVTCQDAAGQAQPACDDATDSARLTVAWDGNLELPRYSATVNRTGDWSVTGLQSETAEFNGMGTFDVSSEFTALYRPVTRTFDLSYRAEYEAIRFATATRRVQSGEIHYDVHAKRTRSGAVRDAEAEFDVQVDVTFLGNGQASIVLDGSRSYEVELSSGNVSFQRG